MSTRIFLLVCAVVPLVSIAQEASPAASAASSPVSAPAFTPAAVAGGSPTVHMPAGGGLGITQEDRDKLTAAHQKALQDPAVQAATVKANAAQEALRAAMVADDKSLGPILDKLKTGGGPASLSPDDRTKVMAERQKMQDSPQVKAMTEAVIGYRTAMRHALELADPTLSPLLDKIDAASRAAAGVPVASKP